MAGVGGAGKGVFVNIILKYLSGEDRIKSVGLDQLLSKFKSYQIATDWLELEEAGEGYTRKESERLVGALKKLTGNKYIQVERKGVDTQEKHRQFITPIISTNMNTKLITDTVSNDRRLVLLKCPYKMQKLLPYEHSTGTITNTTQFIKVMEAELPHFAHYLGTLQHTDGISHTDYMDNTIWKDDDYYEYINDSLDVYSKLLNASEAGNFKEARDALIEAGVPFSTIDRLLSLSNTSRGVVMPVYRSPFSIENNILTLEEVVDATPNLKGLVRRDFKPFKTYLNLTHKGVRGRLHAILFSNAVHLPLDKSITPPVLGTGSDIDLE